MTKAPFRAGMSSEAMAVHAVVPAQAGFYVLELHWRDDFTVETWAKMPIVGWLILEDGSALPSVPHASEHDLGSVVVLTPDGQVLWFEQSWPTAEAWFAEAKAAAEAKARRAAP
jgi:hypothetical protein